MSGEGLWGHCWTGRWKEAINRGIAANPSKLAKGKNRKFPLRDSRRTKPLPTPCLQPSEGHFGNSELQNGKMISLHAVSSHHVCGNVLQL